MRAPALLLGLLLALPALGTADDAVPPEVLRKTLEWMQSSDPGKRAAAFRGVHLLGPEAVPVFQKALRKSRLHHEKELYRLLDNSENPVRELAEARAELAEERKRVYALIKTDFKKDPAEVAMLRREMEDITKAHQRLARLFERDPTAIAEKVDLIAHALADIDEELHRLEEPDSPLEILPLEERKTAALEDSFEGEVYLRNLATRETFAAEVKRHAQVTSHNKSLAWPQGHHRDFATHLNEQRVALGLRPLKLQENLTKASRGHCEDMKRLGFFAHESPIKEKRSPAMRARLAGYGGGFSGECIAAGYPHSGAAYDGWFSSDGHRFILFGGGAGEMGLGRADKHWTFMTGRGK